MKKFIILVALFILCFNQSCLAIINEDDVSSKLSKDIQAEISVNSIDTKDKTLLEYQKKHKKYLKKIPKTSNTWEPSLYGRITIPKEEHAKNHSEILVLLQDGDYAITNHAYVRAKMKDAFEYHEDGRVFGYVEVKYKKVSKSNIFMAVCEYRMNESIKYNKEGNPIKTDNDKPYFKLKHVLFFEVNDNQKDATKPLLAQFVYLADGTLICYQLDNDLYISDSQKNLIPQMKEYYMPTVDKAVKEIKLSKRLADVMSGIFVLIGIVPLTAIFVVFWPLLI